MEIVANVWDRVLVVDDLIDLQIIDNYCNYLESLGEFSLAYIESGKDKIYDDGSGVFQSVDDTGESVYIQKLISSDLVPKLPDHKIHHVTKVHKMIVGSMMNAHTDDNKSIAVTTYANECVGGELVVQNPETGELAKVEPKWGRTIILKCDTPHSVLKVIKGERKSLQTFFTYIKEDETSE